MVLKDLRSVIGEQVKTVVTVASGDNNVVSGELWLFSVDDSIDGLEVKDLYPEDDKLCVTLLCSDDRLKSTDWQSVFNQKSIISYDNGSKQDILEEV